MGINSEDKNRLKQNNIGVIPEDWLVCKVKDACYEIFSGGTPSTKRPEYWGGEIHWLSSGETRNTFIRDTEKTITKEGVENSSTRLARVGDVVVASAGQGYTRGQAAFCLIDTYINQSVVALRARKEKVSPLFLFYNILSRYEELRQWSDAHSSRGSLTTKLLSCLNIQLPSLLEQQGIAEILSELDFKIELNQKMNSNLEAVGEAVFRRWFVDFEFPDEEGKPYKSSGGKMVKSKIGLIPHDWTIRELQEITEIHKTTINPKEFASDVFSYYSFPAYDENKLPALTLGQEIKSQKYLVDNDCVLCSRLNPETKRIWLPYINKKHKAICSTEFIIYKPKREVSRLFIYCLIKNSRFQKFFASLVTGSTGSRQRVPPKDTLKYELAIPKDNNLLQSFNEIIEPIFRMYEMNLVQNKVLSEIRDSLLPKLMSGKIRVPVTEGKMEV